MRRVDAIGVRVPSPTVDPQVDEIRRRCRDDAEFVADLAANGMSQTSLEAALRREPASGAVLEKARA